MQLCDIEGFLAYKRSGDVSARNRLTTSNKGLVQKVAHKMALSCREPYEDLEQVGFLGLIRAIERFDPEKGNAFSSFAIPFIRGAMLHYLRDKANTVSVPRVWQECYQSVRRKQKLHSQLTGVLLSEKQAIAAEGISEFEWKVLSQAIQHRTSPLMPEILEVPTAEIDSEEEALKTERYERLQTALNKLDIGQRQCVNAVFFQEMERRKAARSLDISSLNLNKSIDLALQRLHSLLKEPSASSEVLQIET